MSAESDPNLQEGKDMAQAEEEILAGLAEAVEEPGSQRDRAAKEEMAIARSQFWAIEGCDEETQAE